MVLIDIARDSAGVFPPLKSVLGGINATTKRVVAALSARLDDMEALFCSSTDDEGERKRRHNCLRLGASFISHRGES